MGFQPLLKMMESESSEIINKLTARKFDQIGDTSPVTQDAYLQFHTAVTKANRLNSNGRKESSITVLECQLDLARAAKTLMEEIGKDTPSSAAQKKWKEAKELDVKFAKALEKTEAQVAALERHIEEKHLDSSEWNFKFLIKKIADLKSKPLTLADKKALLETESFSTDSLEGMIKALETIVKKMKTQQQVAEEEAAQKKEAGEQVLNVMTESGYFTKKELEKIGEEVEKGNFNAYLTKAALFERVKPELAKWLREWETKHPEQSTESPERYSTVKPIDHYKLAPLNEQVNAVITRGKDLTLTKLIEVLQKLAEKAKGDHVDDFPSFAAEA